MAYHANVNVIEGDIAVVQSSQASLEMADSPRVFQFNNQAPHEIAKKQLASGVGAAADCSFSPNGKYLVWTIAQRVIVYNLEAGTTTDTATGVNLGSMSFTGDSTTVLIASSSAPYIIAIDLYTGLNKGTIAGSYTFTSNNAVGSGYGNKCYLISKGSSTGSSSIYEYDASLNSITVVHTSGFNYGFIACSESGKFMIAVHGTNSSAAGAGTFIFDLLNLSTSPKYIAATNIRSGSGSASICAYGSSGLTFVMMHAYSSNVPRLIHVLKGASLEDYTLSLMTATGQGAVASTITSIASFGFIYLGNLSSYPFYNESRPVCYIDLRGYTSGSVTGYILPGVNAKYSTSSVSPLFTIRRLAGTVRSQGTLTARKVIVFNRRTMRKIAETTSDNADGTFTIPIYNGEQCIVMAVGVNIDDSQVIDHVAPVV